jgi:hypothetical protein
MISLENTLLSDDIKSTFFSCDLEKCHGACCVEGDAGAPLEEEEISLLEDHIDEIRSFMVAGGIEEVEMTGVFDYDAEGKFVTPLIRGGACAYVYFEGEIARCAIEKAYREGKIPFAKPISCHLYPIRIKSTRTGDLLNYHQWPICSEALKRGKRENLPLFRYLEGALVRKYGQDWYDLLLRSLR